MHWRLLIKDYGPNFIYLPGKKNVAMDALSHLERNIDFCPSVYHPSLPENPSDNHICYME